MQTTPSEQILLPKSAPLHGNLILATMIIGSGMVFLDGTIVNVALPQIQAEYHISVSGLQWLVDIYILFLTVPILVAGSLSDSYGRRKFFNIGLVGFTLASLGCGLATNLDHLLAARAFQGVSGAMMLPGSLAILNASFPPEMRGKTVGTWSAFTPLTTAIGPLLGGWLVDHISWRAAFYINLPLGILTLFLSLRFVPESRSAQKPKQQDWLGAGLITAGLGSFIYGLIEGAEHGWSNRFDGVALLFSLVCLGLFVLVELRASNPILPFSLFKHRVFSGVTLLTFILYFAMSGVFFFLTLNLQQIQGFRATEAGAAFMPIIIILFLISRWAGRLADEHGAHWPLTVGQIIIAAGFFMYLIPGPKANYWLTFFPATVVFGVGLGMVVAPLTSVAMGAVPIHLSGLASGVSNATSRVATMLAVAMLGALMVIQFDFSLVAHTRDLPLSAQERLLLAEEASKVGGAEAPPGLAPEVAATVDIAIEAAFVDAFRLMMGICGLLTLISAGVAALTIKDRMIHHYEDNTFHQNLG